MEPKKWEPCVVTLCNFDVESCLMFSFIVIIFISIEFIICTHMPSFSLQGQSITLISVVCSISSFYYIFSVLSKSLSLLENQIPNDLFQLYRYFENNKTTFMPNFHNEIEFRIFHQKKKNKKIQIDNR